MKSAPRFLILTGLFKVAVCVIFGNYINVYHQKTWSEAREECRKRYTDLSSINSEEEDNAILGLTGELKMWIGLYKYGNDTWKWSGGKNASFFNWAPRNRTSQEGSCVIKTRRGWRRVNCETREFFFSCFESKVVLVKENKTWEEAMEHCRHLNMELMSLLSESALVQALQTSREAQTDHVWTSLRYQADRWLWVDRSVVEPGTSYQAWSPEQMSQCLPWTHHCGALSLEGQQLDKWDCADKLNFLCY